MNYGLYKRIMKRDPMAIDEIESLEEAKEIIKMICGSNQGITNSELYQAYKLPKYCDKAKSDDCDWLNCGECPVYLKATNQTKGEFAWEDEM